MHAPLLLALALAVAPAAVAPAAPAVRHPLTLEDLLAFERVGDPELSPDGKLVAFTAARAGWYDLAAGCVETEELWFPEWEMGVPWERPEAYARQWPSSFVKDWRTPTLVSHGELDDRVTVTRGLAAYTALQRRGVASRLMVFPDENHWVLEPRNTRVHYEEVFGWIERHLDAPKASPKPAPTTP
jgi:fermentation-respiration switch protein FrsA (DUF1100 family)